MLVGVLALQGSVAEHIEILKKINVETLLVKTKEDLEKIDGIILPGGESTAIGRLLRVYGLLDILRNKIMQGIPVYGTCAGLILLANNVIGETPHIGTMNISVKRNAYGRQLSSFSCKCFVEEFNKEIPLVFIRAPWIEEVNSPAKVILELDGRIVCARQNNMLVSSFHPELTDDVTVHEYFINMIKKSTYNK